MSKDFRGAKTSVALIAVVCTERREAEGLQSEFEWMSEMTEDEYNELTPRTRIDVDHIRLQLNKERLRKYARIYCVLCYFMLRTVAHVFLTVASIAMAPCGAGAPPFPLFPSCPFTSSSLVFFTIQFYSLTLPIFLLLSIPYLSTRIVTLRFQAGVL